MPASRPLFRDPIHDGAADPVVIWNYQTETWRMLYTNRRAKDPAIPDIAWLHGTRLGIAESRDDGALWTYRSTLRLTSDRVIDACVVRLPSGAWCLWYND